MKKSNDPRPPIEVKRWKRSNKDGEVIRVVLYKILYPVEKEIHWVAYQQGMSELRPNVDPIYWDSDVANLPQKAAEQNVNVLLQADGFIILERGR